MSKEILQILEVPTIFRKVQEEDNDNNYDESDEDDDKMDKRKTLKFLEIFSKKHEKFKPNKISYSSAKIFL